MSSRGWGSRRMQALEDKRLVGEPLGAVFAKHCTQCHPSSGRVPPQRIQNQRLKVLGIGTINTMAKGHRVPRRRGRWVSSPLG